MLKNSVVNNTTNSEMISLNVVAHCNVTGPPGALLFGRDQRSH